MLLERCDNTQFDALLRVTKLLKIPLEKYNKNGDVSGKGSALGS
jgi:hypothetical protein